MNNPKNELTKTLELTLSVSDEWLVVESYEPESGEIYALDFENESNNPDGWTKRKPENIMMRIGMEVWSWLSLMLDEQKGAQKENDDER